MLNGSTINSTYDPTLSRINPLVEFLNYDNNHFYFYVDLDQLEFTQPVTRALPWINLQFGF